MKAEPNKILKSSNGTYRSNVKACSFDDGFGAYDSSYSGFDGGFWP